MSEAAGTVRARRAAVGFILVSVWLDVLSLGVIIPVFALAVTLVATAALQIGARRDGPGTA